jgi:HAD superfamily hydrolase (TIGR01509 family)
MNHAHTHGVVWDLDGVIVDSAEAHNASWERLAREYNLPYDPATDFKKIFGRHSVDIIEHLWNINDRQKVERMADEKEAYFREAAAHLEPLPGVVELIRSLAESGWPQAIGSSAPRANVDLLLSSIGLASYMQAIATGDDVTVGKPDPQVFLLAFERLGIPPSKGVVIEDAPAGIEAGRRAGAATFGVTTTQTRQTLLDAEADRVVDSLTEITVADLEELVHTNRGRR